MVLSRLAAYSAIYAHAHRGRAHESALLSAATRLSAPMPPNRPRCGQKEGSDE